jgi:hypothetical protein
MWLGLLLGSTIPAGAATINLFSDVGQGCGSESVVTADVAAGATLTTTCVGASPGFLIEDIVKARGVFDQTGLSLGVFAQMRQTIDSNELTDVVTVQARFADVVTLIGGSLGQPATLRATFAIDGMFSASLPPGIRVARFDTLFRVGNSVHNLAGPALIVVDLPYAFGTPAGFTAGFDVSWNILAGVPFGTSASVDVVADFFNSAVLTSVEVRDGAGRPVSGAELRSASGLDYPVIAHTAPEPATLLLSALGLSVGALLRRRPPPLPR